MQTDDLADHLPAASNSECERKNAEVHDPNFEPCGADSQQSNSESKEIKLHGEALGSVDAGVVKGDNGGLPTTEMDRDLAEKSSVLNVTVEMKEVSSVAEDVNCLNSRTQAENGCLNGQDESPAGRQKRDGSPVSPYLSGVKKARVMVDERQPSVHLMFNFLTRDSKRKLEELLQHWSEWHAQHHSSSHDSIEVLESGEVTYYPALRIDQDDSSAVSVWMDHHTRNKEMTPLDSKSIPLYDRGYSWALTSTDVASSAEGGLEMIDSSRCFNCGAYDHSLRECPKPRDNVAVNNARKEYNSKRNLNAANSRNPLRYYQNSTGGKFDGLKPGALDAETRRLLGVGELDPPPWLNRMREIGYPPGYLDPDDEDQPSGIIIFGDEEHEVETEAGEILDANYHPEPPRKMSVQFPGINAPIPENANGSQWSAGPSSSDFHKERWHRRSNYSSEKTVYHDQRRSRDTRDEGLLGRDLRSYPNLFSYPSTYNDYGLSRERSPILERSISDRGRWSPSHSVQNSPPSGPFSVHSDASGSYRRWGEDRSYDPSYSSHFRDRDESHRHHRRR